MAFRIFLALIFLTAWSFGTAQDGAVVRTDSLAFSAADTTGAEVDSVVQSFEVGNRNEFWNEGVPNRYFIYVQYGRRLGGKHDLFLRLNSVWRPGGQEGFSYEADFYPKFSPKTYGYFNFSYSSSNLFPRVRTAAEVFTVLGELWEVSLGIRTTHPPDYNIVALTGTVGLYHGNWFTYVRPTISFLEDGVASNFLAATRRYSGDGRSYLEFMAIYGTDAGVTRDFNAIENTFGLDTWVIRAKAQHAIDTRTYLSAGIDYSGLYLPVREKYALIFGFDILLRRYF